MTITEAITRIRQRLRNGGDAISINLPRVEVQALLDGVSQAGKPAAAAEPALTNIQRLLLKAVAEWPAVGREIRSMEIARKLAIDRSAGNLSNALVALVNRGLIRGRRTGNVWEYTPGWISDEARKLLEEPCS